MVKRRVLNQKDTGKVVSANESYMNKRERAKEVLSWLIYSKKLGSQRELAELMSYSPTVVSSAMTGKIPLSDKLVKRICSMDERLNIQWVMDGEGEMLLSDKPRTTPKAPAIVDSPGHADKEISEQLKNLMQSFAIESERKEKRIKELETHIEDLNNLVSFLLKQGGAGALNAVLGSEHLSTASAAIAKLAK